MKLLILAVTVAAFAVTVYGMKRNDLAGQKSFASVSMLLDAILLYLCRFSNVKKKGESTRHKYHVYQFILLK